MTRGLLATTLAVAVALAAVACGRGAEEAPAASAAPAYALTVQSATPGRDARDVDTSRIVVAGGPLTEIVFALGAGDRVVGVDRTSIFPPEVRALPSVGMFGELGAEGILALSPTAIVATTEAGPAAVLEQLAAAGVDIVRVPDPTRPEDAAERVRALGDLLGVRPRAGEVAGALERGVDAAR
ncbi:MAG: ABC transporter substrate-binding protein, partial [Myxococcales bacterium]|nr:ABC transporter substrate-binding protein [Myxococcales bacterium]